MKHIILYLLIFISSISYSQNTLEKLLKQYNDNGVPYISVEELAMPKTKDILLLDSREPKEFNVSHLKNAICVGYDHFNIDSVIAQFPNRKQKIVVYCSLGIRSETIAERLKAVGYINVENLYGGIFEWKNKNFSVFNATNKETDSIHTFNKDWSKWLKKGIKVYEKEVTDKTSD